MDLLDRMLGHDRWATVVLLDLSQGLTDAQLDQPIDVGHRTVRATLGHIIYNIEFWTALMRSEPAPAPAEDDSPAALAAWFARVHDDFATLSRQMRDEDRLDDIFIDHYDVRKSMGSTIIHVVLHNAEHRAEILHILERVGVPEVPELDHGLWDYLNLNT
jgi:uncharacterized damage-inducible protein DinB